MENWRNYIRESNSEIDDRDTESNWRLQLRNAMESAKEDIRNKLNAPSPAPEPSPKKKGFFDFLRPKWQREDFDAPADGLEPFDDSFYDVHHGGLEKSGIPKLTPPDELPDPPISTNQNQGAPIRNRKALEIDPLPDQEDWEARAAADAGLQQKLKSDRDLNMPSWNSQKDGIIQGMKKEIEEKLEKVSEFEGAKTMTPEEAELHRKRMKSWHDVLGHVDTVPIDLFKVAEEMETMDERIEEIDPTSVDDLGRKTLPLGSMEPEPSDMSPEEEETLAGDFNPFAIFDK